MIAVVQGLFEAVGLVGFAALWAVKALFGVVILRAVRPWWDRLSDWRAGRGGTGA